LGTKTTHSACNNYIDCSIRIARIPSLDQKSEVGGQKSDSCFLSSVICSLSSVIRLSTTHLLLELTFCFKPVTLILSCYTPSLSPNCLCTFGNLIMSWNNSLLCLFSWLLLGNSRCFGICSAGSALLSLLCDIICPSFCRVSAARLSLSHLLSPLQCIPGINVKFYDRDRLLPDGSQCNSLSNVRLAKPHVLLTRPTTRTFSHCPKRP
jgi:hypothetical protein